MRKVILRSRGATKKFDKYVSFESGSTIARHIDMRKIVKQGWMWLALIVPIAGCTVVYPEPSPSPTTTTIVITNPALLTAQEIGPNATFVSNELGDTSFSTGGPEWGDIMFLDVDLSNVAFFENGDETVVVGYWPVTRETIGDYMVEETHVWMDRLPEYIRRTDQNYVSRAVDGSDDWRIWEVPDIDGGYGFQGTSWFSSYYGDHGGLPVSIEDRRDDDKIDTSSTARAYGLIDDYFVMVRIDNNNFDPPTDEQLRSLWNKQLAKIQGTN